MSKLLVLLSALLGGCAGSRGPGRTLILCDHSTSSGCDERLVQRAAMEFIAKAEPGSRLEVLEIGCGADDLERRYQVDVPTRWGSGAAQRKRAWREAEERHLVGLRLGRRQRCSGIAAGLSEGARVLREGAGWTARRLVIVSDLREASSESGLNFERSVPPPAAFVERLRDRGMLADLRGLDVSTCGVHDGVTADAKHWTAKQAGGLRAAWAAAFRTMSAGEVELREECPWSPEADKILSAGGRW